MSYKIRCFPEAGLALDYTPGSAVAAGEPVAIAGIAGVAQSPIAANVLGSLMIAGLCLGKKDNSDIAAGDRVGWDANGSPVGGTALSGAVTSDPTKVDIWLGKTVYVAGASATEVYFLLNGLGGLAHVADAAAITQDTLTDSTGGAAGTTLAAATNVDTLTDSTSGTADDTVANVGTAVTGVDGSGSNAASQADVDTRLTAINNNFKELTDQVITQKALNTVLINAVASLAAQLAKVKTDAGAVRTTIASLNVVNERSGLVKTS